MYNTNQTNIGEILRSYRKIKHLSLEDVGNKIYKSKATISKYEKGEIIPDFITTLELCNVLGINLSDILPLDTESTILANPFYTDTLYLYYVTSNKLISSIIKINHTASDVFQAQFYNGVKTDIVNCAYYYEGSLEFLDNIAYVNLKNVSVHKSFPIYPSFSNSNSIFLGVLIEYSPKFICMPLLVLATSTLIKFI